jgi:hypothetical protein
MRAYGLAGRVPPDQQFGNLSDAYRAFLARPRTASARTDRPNAQAPEA